MSSNIIPSSLRDLSSIQTQSALAAICGVLSHVLFFIHGERDLQPLRILIVSMLAQISLSAYLFTLYDSFVTSFIHIIFVDIFFLTSISTSILVYRLAFHPLRHFPGPFWSKVSKAYAVVLSLGNRYAHDTAEMHNQYGDFVRIGPNELHISNVDAVIEVHGPQSKCVKSATYGVFHHKGQAPLPTSRDKVWHKEQRRVWDQAFSTRALLGYEPRVMETVTDWLDQVKANEGKPMNTSHWSTLVAYDTMGKVGFSEDWEAVKDGGENPILQLLEATFTPMGKMGRWTWPLSVILDVLEGSPEQLLFRAWAVDTMMNRMKRKDVQGDISAPLIKGYHDAGATQQGQILLEAEAQAILVAASDTVSNMLSWIFYYTTRDSQLQERLRKDLEPCFKGGKTPSNRELESIPLLNGIINEAMRLEPSVSLGSPRQTPPEGITIGGKYVPGDVTVFVVQRALHRDARYFPDPLTFIPERWFSRPELAKDKRAFSPFIIGPYNCVGRQLALMEARMVLANTVWNYEMEFAPGENGSRIINETIDIVILKAGRLDLVFRKRE